jgi:hypothetical protein
VQEGLEVVSLEDVDVGYPYVGVNEPVGWDLVFLDLVVMNRRFANY